MSDIVIRHAEPRDAEPLRQLTAHPEVYHDTLQLPHPSMEMWQERLLPKPGSRHLVATVDEQVVGHLRLSVEPSPRRSHVATFGVSVAAQARGRGVGSALMREPALVAEITNLVEDPHGVLGHFEERYLELPERILTTVMRKHQRYLPVYRDGKLAPHFVTMANGLCDDDTVRAGNESVIRARYEDALFFWNADLTTAKADEFVPGLDKLTFEERLGSVGLRARRIADVAARLGARVGLTGGGDLPPLPRRVGVVGGAAAVIHAEPAVLQIALHPAVDLVVGYRVFLRHSAVIFPVFQTVQHHDHPLHRRHGAGAALGAACALAAVAGVVQGRARTVLPHPMHQRLVIDVIF